ncbi:MAG: MMPL family transporter [Stappiaceae bacterium]
MLAFGIHRLGLLAIRFPFFSLLIILVVTGFAVQQAIEHTRFNGDIVRNLESGAEEFARFRALEQEFHKFSTDEVIMIEAPDLGDTDSYEALSNLILELQISPDVRSVFSIFSLADSVGKDDIQPYLSRETLSDLPPSERLDKLQNAIPLAKQLLSKDRTATLVILSIDGDEDASLSALTPEALEELNETLDFYKDDLKVSLIGLPEIHRTVRVSLRNDQIKVGVISSLFCLLVAIFIFRSLLGAIICAVPPMLSVVWYFGALAALGYDIDTLSTIIPTLILVLAFADGLHLFFSWRNGIRLRKLSQEDALRYAILKVGPACAMTSLTTAAAFIGIGIGGGDRLGILAISGTLGVMGAFFAVIFVLPTLATIGTRFNIQIRRNSTKLLGIPVPPAKWIAANARGPAIVVGLIIFCGLGAIHLSLPAGFQLNDYLPETADIRLLEARADSAFEGSGRIFAVIEGVDDGLNISNADLERINRVRTTISSVTGQDPAAGMEMTEESLSNFDLENMPEEIEPIVRRFVSQDGGRFLLAMPISNMQTSNKTSEYAARIEAALDEKDLASHVYLTGFPLLAAREAPKLIDDLRQGLLTAVAIAILLIIISARSISLGIACIVPNLLPILSVEAYFWFTNQPVSMTAVIALTIGFGIAVDNSVHLLNRFLTEKKDGSSPDEAMRRAIEGVSPAIVASTLLLAAGLAVTLASALPTVFQFGILVIATLLFALLADLMLLPAFALVLSNRNRS